MIKLSRKQLIELSKKLCAFDLETLDNDLQNYVIKHKSKDIAISIGIYGINGLIFEATDKNGDYVYIIVKDRSTLLFRAL